MLFFVLSKYIIVKKLTQFYSDFPTIKCQESIMYKILIVDDNVKFAEFLQMALTNETMEADIVFEPVCALQAIANNNYDLMISDLHLPDINGVQLAKSIRTMKPKIKVIILTGQPTENSELESIYYNVDHYIEKSKSINIIYNYVENLLQRDISNEEQSTLYSKSENILINLTEHSVMKDNEEYDLTPSEFKLLTLFLKNKSITLSRETISQDLFGYFDPKSRSIDVHL